MPLVRLPHRNILLVIEAESNMIKTLKMKWGRLARQFLSVANIKDINPKDFYLFKAQEIIDKLEEEKRELMRQRTLAGPIKQDIESTIKQLKDLYDELKTLDYDIRSHIATRDEVKKKENVRDKIWDVGIGPDAPSSDTPTDTDDWLREKLMEQMD